MNFMQTLLSILQCQPEIPSLPPLIYFKRDGQVVVGNFSEVILGMLIRLQTLMASEHEKGAMFEHDTTQGLEATPGQVMTAMANQLAIQEDSAQRTIMLERLIQEIVRDVAPAECEHFNVRYHVSIDLKVIRSEAPRERFLD